MCWTRYPETYSVRSHVYKVQQQLKQIILLDTSIVLMSGGKQEGSEERNQEKVFEHKKVYDFTRQGYGYMLNIIRCIVKSCPVYFFYMRYFSHTQTFF